ncbi:hypothetical protein C8R48DRAFT_600904 [Suillus tomentosus]|nr:hypothetical protein C8R48DRAFT_600904 [Suillus tomentosus]
MIPSATQSKQPVREAWTLERLQLERSLALGCAIETTTASAYDSHLNSYLNFCRLHNRDVEPTADTLSFFVVWLSHHIEPRSMDSYLSGIVNRLQTHFPQVRDVRTSLLVTRTLKGCKRRLSKPVRRKEPLTLDDLAVVVDMFASSTDFNDILFVALLVTGFKTLQRLAELCWPNAKKHQSYRKMPLRHSLVSSPASASYTLPHHKTSTRTTALAATGVTPALIQAAGRWSSDEFQKYIRKHPYLLHLLIHGSQNL